MNASVKRGLIISIIAGLLGGGANYLMEGDVAKALVVVGIGFVLGLIIMFLFSLGGGRRD
ncbi:hypothetical protein CPHO_09925 [Corynebacterium phocae]|uniref:Uncharacterized protein n=1 Tax=Corynebacterium phocae TaxID=161895 RepID=A0A1L7D578_9CORY|nr:hypothetical protein [Corynebacterium phocae]APT93153.1 hypothetical protein CPHO_09925 [Corynebacterium phocae]KAA8722232.1 hypothetical protein F4V58_09400 [Corynebacterium phocae]